MLSEGEGYDLQKLLPPTGTAYGWFKFSPSLPGGYAYQIGHPEGDDETPFRDDDPGDLH